MKPDTGTETVDVYVAGISVKVTRLTLGGLSLCLILATDAERYRDGVAEVSRRHSSFVAAK